MSNELQSLLSQGLVFVDAIPRNVGDRHLGGGYQVVVLLPLQFEQVFFKLGQLPGAVQGCLIHDVGHVDFGITVQCCVLIQHKLH